MVELGRHKLLLGDLATAADAFKAATHLNELDMGAMLGSLECELLMGQVGASHGGLLLLYMGFDTASCSPSQ